VTADAGREAEARAAAFLTAQGLACIARNYRCRFGEIDLVMRDGRTVVFVEVRARGSSRYGGAGASITASKRRRVLAAARHYLAGRSPLPPCRFDAVLIEGDDLEWLKGAFSAD
jgi:putative endonuclease